ncbi:hypothetical protein MRX96_032328 [Rhipicephalus microplus]
MEKNSRDKKTTKAKSGKVTGDKPQDFLKGDRVAAPKHPAVQTATESSEDDSGESWDTVSDEGSLRQERRARKAGKHIASQDSQANEDSSAEEDKNSTRRAPAALFHAAEQEEKSYEQEFPTLISSDTGTPGDGRDRQGNTLSKIDESGQQNFSRLFQ